MDYVKVQREDGLAVVVLERGKVNALNEAAVGQLHACLDELDADEATRALLLTAEGKFFSFGFDVPQFMAYSRDDFTRFLEKFTSLYTKLYLFPKPTVAGLNGHAVAGGCMLATACDRRVMATGRARISLNEITFGASVFAGLVAMLKATVGQRNAETILYSGKMYGAEEAQRLGLVDVVAQPTHLPAVAREVARDLAGQDRVAFRSMKHLLRRPVADEARRSEADSIREFVEIWYSDETRAKLKRIEIRA